MSDNKKKRRRKEPAAIAALRENQSNPAATATAPKASAPAPAKATRGQFQDPLRVIKPTMSAYLFIKEWWKARERGDFEFLYALTTEDGALRAHFGDSDAFPDVCRRKMRPVNGIEVGELVRIRLNGPHEAHVIQVYGAQERGARKYRAERLVLLATDKGWRAHQADVAEVSRDVPTNEVFVDVFEQVELPAWFTTWVALQPADEAVPPTSAAGEIVVGAAAAAEASQEA